jgi:hypothetical protein
MKLYTITDIVMILNTISKVVQHKIGLQSITSPFEIGRGHVTAAL